MTAALPNGLGPTSGRKFKVLVAEDNLINQRIVVGLLNQLGHTGVVVGDGEKALRCLAQLHFDAVFMEVMMPQMDGLEALASLRAQEATTFQNPSLYRRSEMNWKG